MTISQEIAARNALEISKRTLQGIINPFLIIWRAPVSIKLFRFTYTAYDSMEEWVTLAEQKNFSLRIQQIAYEMAEQEIQKAKAGHYPTLDLVAQYSNQQGVGGAITGRGIDLESKSVGLQLNVPIFQGFSTQSRVRETLANRDKIRQELENTRRTVGLQVRQHYLNVTNGMPKSRRSNRHDLRRVLDSISWGRKWVRRSRCLNAATIFLCAEI